MLVAEDDSKPPQQTLTPSASSPSSSKLNKAVADELDKLQLRLKKLRLEEELLKGRIATTERKQMSLRHGRESYSNETHVKSQHRVAVARSRSAAHAAVQSMRAKHREALTASQSRTLQQRNEAVLDVKLLRRLLDCQRHITAAEERNKIQEMHDAIRQHHTGAHARSDAAAERKHCSVRQVITDEINRDAQEREEKWGLTEKLLDDESALRGRVEELRRLDAEKRFDYELMLDEGIGSAALRAGTSERHSIPHPPPDTEPRRVG